MLCARRLVTICHTMSAPPRRPVIVVGYDGSPLSRTALALAARHAGRRGRLIVVHAFGPRTPVGALAAQAGAPRETADHGRALLDTIPLTGDELVDVEYETALLEGPAAAALTEVAQANDADEIVVGARGLGVIQSLLGSVSRQLLEISDRPVVIIPAAAAGREERAATDVAAKAT